MGKASHSDGQMGIYQITCLSTGKIYIGSSTDIGYRWYRHKKDLNNGHHNNSLLKNAWSKYGEQNFIFQVIQPVLNQENLHTIEEQWIRLKNSTNREIGFNLTDVCTKSPTFGKKMSDETKAKLSAINKGKKWTDDQRARLKIVRSKQDLKAIGQKAAETRRLKDIKPTPESRVKAWETRRQRNLINQKLWKPVIGCDDLGNEVVRFNSTTEAYKNGYKGVVGAIKRCIRCGGLYWKYDVTNKEEVLNDNSGLSRIF